MKLTKRTARLSLKKEITFFIKTQADRELCKPLVRAAEKLGYKTDITEDGNKKCEIGFYCQHVNAPENAKFSAIMLHDLLQAYPRWPDIWQIEVWNKYDIGFLPATFWANMWKRASYHDYCRPRGRVYQIGWPKADIIATPQFEEQVNTLRNSLQLDPSKKTVLYAPSWENDGKQDDFVQAALLSDVNILIKQSQIDATWKFPGIPNLYLNIKQNIQQMAALHKNIPNVTMLDPKTNILHALAVSDILVSDESSTMCEAVLMHKPAIAVEDWLVPDTVPSRHACSGHAFTIKATRDTLTGVLKDVLKNYKNYEQDAISFQLVNIKNIGTSATKMMKVLDKAVMGEHILIPALKRIYKIGIDADAVFRKAWALYDTGDFEKAITLYTQVIKSGMMNEVIALHYASLITELPYNRKYKYDAALRYLDVAEKAANHNDWVSSLRNSLTQIIQQNR
ncbi:hypothetical protein AGMMS49942_29930 [Spirochaetia bacterium]|nr:hypothetical protein AGMMS49942_29930 [Spirochaetia bacterium]